ncbi:MAG: T9SS type A sorting domain-containing protein, partial [Candidatus Cloacimonetes bacterium]|nr:T9SS type A sorting domain-containing protein [Candidatus Cloacimonadota bacterium]
LIISLIIHVIILTSFCYTQDTQVIDTIEVYIEDIGINVSVIQCEYLEQDTKLLDSGWNWVSFPVLPNPAGTNALDVLEPILDPDVLEEVVYEDQPVIYYDFTPPNPHWVNYLEDGNFHSIDGYKIKMHTDAELEIAGVLEDPGTVIHLYAEVDKAPWPPPLGVGNWIGYFIPGSQLWQFAFAQIWDKITFIKADDWSYISGYSMPPSLCTVDYGKLYIVGVSEDCSFTWGLGLQQNPYTKSETSIFSYQEQADYMPIFVDSTEALNGIDEIGVFLEDECISASKIEGFPVFIPAYIEEDSTGSKDFNELTFQVASYGKGGKRSIPAFVYNETQNAFVEESVILDAKSYAIIRLGTGAGTEFQKEFTLYQNYPNPITSSTTISFIPSPGVEKSEIKIYNIKGQLVITLTLMTNDKSPVTSIVWDGKDKTGKFLASGIYLYKLISGDKSEMKKMVVIR